MISIFGSLIILVATQHIAGHQFDTYVYDETDDNGGLKKLWGLQNVYTTMGKLFHYAIPEDAFSKKINTFEISNSANKPLPDWIVYNSESKMLEGVPLPTDIGVLSVMLRAADFTNHTIRDFFEIEVMPILDKNTDPKKKCDQKEKILMMSVVIRRILKNISPKKRINAMKNASRYLGIDVEGLLLLSEEFNIDPQSDALLTAGNVKSNASDVIDQNDIPNDSSSILSWQVGCGDRIWGSKIKSVERVKRYSKAGVLEDILELPVSQWKMTSSPNPFRRRRHVIRSPMQSKPKSGANEDEDEEEDEEDGEGDAEGEADYPDTAADGDDNLIENDDQVANKSTTTALPTLEHKETPQIDPVEEPDLDETEYQTESYIPSDDDKFDEIGSFHPLRGGSGKGNSTSAPFYTVNSTPTSIALSTSFLEKEPPIMGVTKKINTAPVLHRHFGPIFFAAGKINRTVIPEDTFMDAEDGNTRNLTISVKSNANSTRMWFDFSPDTQEFVFLPAEAEISRYDFILQAQDSGGLISTYSLPISVQNPKNLRSVNFEMSMALKTSQPITLQLQLRILEKLARLYGDKGLENINLRSISVEPFAITWTNDTLSTKICDFGKIERLVEVLTKEKWVTEVKESVKKYFDPEVSVQEITWKAFGDCERIVIKPHWPLSKSNTRVNEMTPIVKKPIDKIFAMNVGQLFTFKIPEDTFFDSEQKSARYMRLYLLPENGSELSEDSFIQFNSTSQEIYAFPTDKDVGRHIFTIKCVNSANNYATQGIEVLVVAPSAVKRNVVFTIGLNNSYDSFVNSVAQKKLLVEKLSNIFSDKDTSMITLGNIARGSVVVTWYNTSLDGEFCREGVVSQLRKQIVDDNGGITSRARQIMEPEFTILYAFIMPMGMCLGGLTEVHKIPAPSLGGLDSDIFAFARLDYFYTIILPSVIAVVMLLLAALIACVLYKRRNRGKLDVRGNVAYRSRGIPVIFRHEIDEKQKGDPRGRLFIPEEKGPSSPSDFYGMNQSQASTALLSDFEDPNSPIKKSDVAYELSQQSDGRSFRKPMTYRKPPPYNAH